MQLKATALGKHLAQHPYDQAEILTAGVRVSGPRHEYVIPFNQLLAIHCKRGLVWGEMEFVLTDDKVVRLHGTQWQETQRFWQQLSDLWTDWSQKMSVVASGVLSDELAQIQCYRQGKRWVSYQDVARLRQQIHNAFNALPLPVPRLAEFVNCRDHWRQCQQWLDQAQTHRDENNVLWTEKLCQQHADFFNNIRPLSLTPSQISAVVSEENTVLVSGGAGCGKTTTLVARAAWLLHSHKATPEQILLLAFSPDSAQQMEKYLAHCPHNGDLSVSTFHTLVSHIIEQATNKTAQLSPLEQDHYARYQWLTVCWQQQCADKKSAANGWRNWLQTWLTGTLSEGNFWQDEQIIRWLAPRLDDGLQLIRLCGGGQKQLVERVAENLREPFSKQLALLMPLYKAWKAALKAQGAVDFYAQVQQAINLLERGRFISPWKYILSDDVQDLSAQQTALLAAFRKQNPSTVLLAAGDDWQAVHHFPDAQQDLLSAFNQHFGAGDSYLLDSSFRLGSRTGDIASQFVRQNPRQRQSPLHCLSAGDKKSITLLPEEQLAPLLDKLSGFAKPHQRVLVLARHCYLRPPLLEIAATRWPTLNIEFMTLQASKGQQADYCIVSGLNSTIDGLPAESEEPVIEQALLAAESFPYAFERRLLYVALTRARQRVWLLYDKQHPSLFVSELKQLGVPVAKKP